MGNIGLSRRRRATGRATVSSSASAIHGEAPGFPQTDQHPVTRVSWDDAQTYVSWLSRTTGATYRLPTEAEWERAASGSVDGCGIRDADEGTCPVGASVANAAGLFDMVGNLWEWTENCWEVNCGVRVARGGSWFETAEGPAPRRAHPGLRRLSGWHRRLSRVEGARLTAASERPTFNVVWCVLRRPPPVRHRGLDAGDEDGPPPRHRRMAERARGRLVRARIRIAPVATSLGKAPPCTSVSRTWADRGDPRQGPAPIRTSKSPR